MAGSADLAPSSTGGPPPSEHDSPSSSKGVLPCRTYPTTGPECRCGPNPASEGASSTSCVIECAPGVLGRRDAQQIRGLGDTDQGLPRRAVATRVDETARSRH